MDFGLSPEEQAFKQEVVAFFDRELKPEVIEELATGNGPGPATKAFYQLLGSKGWLTINWPKKYGGLDGTCVQRLIVTEELAYRRAFYTMVGPAMAGPTILLVGSEEMKEEFLPRIARCEIDFALGYTEPDAGSDLASLDIRAVEDGDYYVINGQKMFNTDCHYADYHWLGARTDPTVSKHKGISLFVVDLKSPGIEIRPIYVLDGMRTNVVYYEDVRVPKRNLVGMPNMGFYYIATALDFERVLPVGDFRRDFEDLLDCVKRLSRDGVPLARDPLVRQRLAESAIEVEAAWLLAFRIAWMIDRQIVPNHEASMLKMYVTEAYQRLGLAAHQILGPLGQLVDGSQRVPAGGRFSQLYLNSFIRTVAGGTSEIQRTVIALRGLGLPRK
ncbi:MAG: acyl-CoA dehydrogenase family protein [Chloroflexota bacterium]